MKKTACLIVSVALFCLVSIVPAYAALTHTVASGDSMWKIATKYQVGVSEIIKANPQIKNPDLIYPGEVLQIPSVNSSVRTYETEVIRLANEYRVKNGLKALTENWELSRVARYKAQDMHDSGYFAHKSPVYGDPFQMIKSFGLAYRAAGENIAMGYKTPQAVVTGWINSPDHRANLLNKNFTQIGVGYCADGNYWSQMFIG